MLHVDQLRNRFCCGFTLSAHYRPRLQVRASRTYMVAPYGRMLCAMLASWHCPRANGQTLVNPTHSSSWDRTAQVAMETGGLWLPRGDEEKGREGGRDEGRRGSQVSESNKSDRSQWSEVELAPNLAFNAQFRQKQPWC